MSNNTIATSLARWRRKLRNQLGGSDLDVVIKPEISDDGFARLITDIASRADVRTAIEIGSSNGAGSTSALVKGLSDRPDPLLVCLELSKPRFEELKDRFSHLGWIHCLNEPSVPVDQFPTEEDVSTFVKDHGSEARYENPLSEILRWRRQDIEYVERNYQGRNGIRTAFELAQVTAFDLVLIDGSEFTGSAEWRALEGAKYVLLDDVVTFKNHATRAQLLRDDRYELIDEDLSCRNGYSVFGLR